jgi:hypothetical protein
MKMTELRKLLKDNKTRNPFNDAYDGVKMISLIQQKVTKEEFAADPLRFTIGITDFMNGFFTEFFAIVKEKLATANVPHKEFVELLILAFNRNYLVVLKSKLIYLRLKTACPRMISIR